MTNQISKDKKRVGLVLDKKLIAQLDAEAVRTGVTRTDVVTKACLEHLRLDPIPASASQVEEVRLALIQLAQGQESTARKLIDAIDERPQLNARKKEGRFERLKQAWKA